MAAIMLQTIPRFYAKISEKRFFLSAKTYEKYIVCKDYCTTTRRIFYPLVLIVLYKMEKLRSCYIDWIHFVSPMNTWTVCIPCSSTD